MLGKKALGGDAFEEKVEEERAKDLYYCDLEVGCREGVFVGNFCIVVFEVLDPTVLLSVGLEESFNLVQMDCLACLQTSHMFLKPYTIFLDLDILIFSPYIDGLFLILHHGSRLQKNYSLYFCYFCERIDEKGFEIHQKTIFNR